jgi:site-specific recombinase XerD
VIPTFKTVAESWLNAKKQNIRQNTFHQYRGHVDNHLTPFFGERKITQITFDSVETFLSHCHEQKMAIPTTRKILINLGAIMTYACRKRYIDYNPIRDVEKPRGRSEH